MSEYDNDLSGVLFKNDRKEKTSQPDYKGSCEIDGEEFWIAAWIKDGKKGKFMSLAFTPKEETAPPPPAPMSKRDRAEAWKAGAQKPSSSGFEDMDDDIPF